MKQLYHGKDTKKRRELFKTTNNYKNAFYKKQWISLVDDNEDINWLYGINFVEFLIEKP